MCPPVAPARLQITSSRKITAQTRVAVSHLNRTCEITVTLKNSISFINKYFQNLVRGQAG